MIRKVRILLSTDEYVGSVFRQCFHHSLVVLALGFSREFRARCLRLGLTERGQVAAVLLQVVVDYVRHPLDVFYRFPVLTSAPRADHEVQLRQNLSDWKTFGLNGNKTRSKLSAEKINTFLPLCMNI